MKVLAYDKFPNPNAGLEYVELEEIFRKADIISLHCPLTEETHHMIGDDAVEMMKPGVVIVNTSRGGLIDTESLEMVGGGGEVAAIMAITKVAALAYLMFNLFTPPCFAAIGAMNAEMKSAKWLWGGIGLQLAVGYTVAYLVYTIGTLLMGETLSVGAAIGGGIAVLAMAAVVAALIIRTNRQLKKA